VEPNEEAMQALIEVSGKTKEEIFADFEESHKRMRGELGFQKNFRAYCEIFGTNPGEMEEDTLDGFRDVFFMGMTHVLDLMGESVEVVDQLIDEISRYRYTQP